MAHSDQLTAVTSISHRPVLLDDILRPLWKCLRFSGLHHGFLPLSEEHRLVHILRRSLTVLIQALVSGLGVFQLVQLVITITNRKSIADISFNVVISTYCLMAIVFMHQLYARHDQLVQFFRDWRQMETSFFNCRNRGRVTKVARVLNGIFFGLLVVFIPQTTWFNLFVPLQSFWFSSIENLREKLGLHFLVSLFTVSIYFTMLFLLLSQIVPTIFYYQAGCMIENLELELQSCSTPVLNGHDSTPRNGNCYQLMWDRYESIQRLVCRANHLFGLIMATNQFSLICMNCLQIYVIITVKNVISFIALLTAILVFVAITVATNCLVSHLNLSCGELKNSVAILLNTKWSFLDQEERELLGFFFHRLDKDDLAACPLNLYTIDRTNLLGLLTLHISYIIVLLQSK